jgi:DNA ligase-associated metallophosphoesterase
MLDPAGAAFWPAKRMLILADLHIEKPSAMVSRAATPAYDTRATLERLNRLLRLYHPAKVIVLGNSLQDRAGNRLAKDDRARIEAMAREANFIWIANENDSAPTGLPGVSVPLYREGPFTFRHMAVPQLKPREIEISGHFHPKASIDVRAKRVSRSCFVTDANRLVLPAFGTRTDGLDVRDPTIARLFPRGLRVFLLGQDQLFSFALEQLGRMAEVA